LRAVCFTSNGPAIEERGLGTALVALPGDFGEASRACIGVKAILALPVATRTDTVMARADTQLSIFRMTGLRQNVPLTRYLIGPLGMSLPGA
jgi:hypothetical protein